MALLLLGTLFLASALVSREGLNGERCVELKAGLLKLLAK